MIPSSFTNTNPKDSKLGSHIFPLMLVVLSKLAKFGTVILMCRQIIQLFSILVPDIAGFLLLFRHSAILGQFFLSVLHFCLHIFLFDILGGQKHRQHRPGISDVKLFSLCHRGTIKIYECL
jgi:hypothetical protein